MRKSTKFFALILTTVLAVCTGCSTKQATAEMNLPTMMDEMLLIAPINDPLVLTESDMLDFYGIQSEQMEQFSAVLCSNGISAQELVMVEAVDETSGDVIEEKLQQRLASRLAESKNYLPEEYAVISGCEVARDGLYIRMLIHAETNQLVAYYNQKLRP